MKFKFPQFILLAFASFFVAFPAAAATPAHLAQSEELETLRQEVIETTAALETASSTEELQKEIQTRKEALLKIFTFSIEETKELLAKDRVKELVKEKTELGKLTQELVSLLKEYQTYIEDQVKTLENPELTLEEVKTIAADFKVWREESYNPAVKSTLDLLLVDKGFRALEVTKARFVKIQSDVLKLEALKQTEAGLFNDSIKAVEDALDKVEELQGVAKTTLDQEPIVLVLKTPEPEEETPVIAAIDEDIATSSAVAMEMSIMATGLAPTGPEISEVIQEAVNLIKDTIYQEFFEMSKLARALLK